MRALCFVLLAALPLSTGCAAFLNASGTDLETLHNKSIVHETLGTPIASGELDGILYEDFRSHRKISQKWNGEYFVIGDCVTLGFGELIWFPEVLGASAYEMVKGHDYRISYEADGSVKAILVDGCEFSHGILRGPPTREPKGTAPGENAQTRTDTAGD